jgi:hypothetical protein
MIALNGKMEIVPQGRNCLNLEADVENSDRDQRDRCPAIWPDHLQQLDSGVANRDFLV